jgi:hypothetical protein
MVGDKCNAGDGSRKTGAADEQSRVAVKLGETLWGLAGEKYCLSGADQVAATVELMKQNNLSPEIGTRNGKTEWVGKPYRADRNYKFPPISEIPGLSKKTIAPTSVEKPDAPTSAVEQVLHTVPRVPSERAAAAVQHAGVEVDSKPERTAAPPPVVPSAPAGKSLSKQLVDNKPSGVLDSVLNTPETRLNQVVVPIEGKADNSTAAEKGVFERVGDLGRGIVHGIVEAPINGLTQLANHATDGSLALPQLRLVESENQGTAFTVGSIAGSILPAYLIYRGVGKMIGNPVATEKTAEILGSRSTGTLLKTAVVQGGVTGAVFEGGFVPIRADEGDFWQAKARHTTQGFVAGTILTAGNFLGRAGLMRNGIGASENWGAFAAKEVPAQFTVGTASGVVAGSVNANVHSLMAEGRFATGAETGRDALTMGLFGGAFNVAVPLHQRLVKAAKITPEQLSEISHAQKQTSGDQTWTKSYKGEFPAEERQPLDSVNANLKDGSMQLYETRAKNGKLLSWNIVEKFPAQNEAERDFFLNCYLATIRQAQSIGLGGVHLRNAFKSVHANNPKASGIMTEIESTVGAEPGSQPVRRRNFYADNNAREVTDPYEIPLFQPDEAAAYIPQRQIPGAGPIPATMLFEPFQNQTVTGADVRHMVRRVYTDGYGIDSSDPYLSERLNAIPMTTDSHLRPLTRTTGN